jgi:hypothetical protein
MPPAFRNAIITIFVTFLLFISSIFFKLNEYFSQELDPVSFSFSLSVVVAICGLLLSLANTNAAYEEKIEAKYNSIIENQSNFFNSLDTSILQAVKKLTSAIAEEQSFRIIGSPSDAMEYIFSDLSDVVSVDNTYIRYKDYSQIDDKLYPPNWHSDIVNKIKDFCKSDGPRIWRDVVSNDEKRRHEIASQILSDTSVGSYLVNVVDSTPVINYIILNRQNNDREVLFGWASIKDYPTNKLVFSSKNPELASYFSHHFNILFNEGERFGLTKDGKE